MNRGWYGLGKERVRPLSALELQCLDKLYNLAKIGHPQSAWMGTRLGEDMDLLRPGFISKKYHIPDLFKRNWELGNALCQISHAMGDSSNEEASLMSYLAGQQGIPYGRHLLRGEHLKLAHVHEPVDSQAIVAALVDSFKKMLVK